MMVNTVQLMLLSSLLQKTTKSTLSMTKLYIIYYSRHRIGFNFILLNKLQEIPQVLLLERFLNYLPFETLP